MHTLIKNCESLSEDINNQIVKDYMLNNSDVKGELEARMQLRNLSDAEMENRTKKIQNQASNVVSGRSSLIPMQSGPKPSYTKFLQSLMDFDFFWMELSVRDIYHLTCCKEFNHLFKRILFSDKINTEGEIFDYNFLSSRMGFNQVEINSLIQLKRFDWSEESVKFVLFEKAFQHLKDKIITCEGGAHVFFEDWKKRCKDQAERAEKKKMQDDLAREVYRRLQAANLSTPRIQEIKKHVVSHRGRSDMNVFVSLVCMFKKKFVRELLTKSMVECGLLKNSAPFLKCDSKFLKCDDLTTFGKTYKNFVLSKEFFDADARMIEQLVEDIKLERYIIMCRPNDVHNAYMEKRREVWTEWHLRVIYNGVFVVYFPPVPPPIDVWELVQALKKRMSIPPEWKKFRPFPSEENIRLFLTFD